MTRVDLDPDPDPGSFGFVLCGGASRRMGADKASLVLDGLPMGRRVADALVSAGIERVAAVGGSPRLASELGVAHVPDRWPGEGPLGALITALEVAGPDASAIVLPCDLLTPSPTAIRHVLAVRQRTAADAAVPVAAGRRQWLHAAWHGRVETILSDVFASGERSIVGATLGLRMVTVDDVAEAVLADADTPGDLPTAAEE